MRNSLLVILLRQWFVVAAAVGVFIAGWAAYLCVTTPLYTSTALLHVQRPEAHGPNAPEADPDFLDTQAEIFSSTAVLAIAASDPALAGVSRLHRAADPVEWLRRSVGVEVDRPDSRMTVSFDAAEPQAADRVLAVVIAAYQRYVGAQGHSPGAGLLEFLANEKQQRETELARKTQQLQDHAKQYGTPTTRAAEGDRSNPIARRLGEMTESLAASHREAVDAGSARQAVAETILSNPKYAAELAELRGTGLGEDFDRIRSKREQARAQLADLRKRYLPGHPALDAAQRDLDHLDVTYAVAADERYERAKRVESEAQRAFDDLQKEAREQRARDAEYAWLEAEVNVARRHVEALENRINEAARASAPRIDLVAAPRAASEPTKPQPGRTAGLALVVGLLTGAALAGARDAYSARFRAAGDAEAALGLPVLARIPAAPRLVRAGPIPPSDQENHLVAAIASGVNGDVNGKYNGNGDRGGAADERDPFADIATAYLALRGSGGSGGSERQDTVDLTQAEFDRRRDRTILVTSSVPREGKSTVASRLAVSLAYCGRWVLLVDANLRRPTQQALFALGRGPGLADVLADRAALDDAIRPTPVANLQVLTAGRTAADPLVLLNRAELVELLERVAEAYDHVIVDSPAVRGGADARVIAAACDATLLVLRNTEANLRTSVHARDALAVVGANVIGVILNTVPQAAAPSQGDAAEALRPRQRPASPLDPLPAA